MGASNLKTSFLKRYSFDSLATSEPVEDPSGNIFIFEKFQWNSDEMSVLHSGIDTAKQLYFGFLDETFLMRIDQIYQSEFGGFIELVDHDGVITPFMVTSGRRGGYHYALVNQELGLVILVKSTRAKSDKEYSHLKIELSPHLIMQNTPDYLQSLLDGFAKQIMFEPQHVGIALHICADIQGVEIPDDFDRQLTTRSRRKYSVTGISELNLAANSAKYGENQSYVFGSQSSTQLGLYRKDIEAKENDKMYMWGSKWSQALNRYLEPCYSPDQPVWRVELRFHHTVIDELARDQGIEIKTLYDAFKYVQSFWQYGLERCFRWDLSPYMIHPAWQYLIESVFVKPFDSLSFKRRMKKTPGEGNQKNVALAIGNLLSIYARNKFPIRYVMKNLRGSGIWNDILKYYELKTGIFDDQRDLMALIMQDIEQKLMVKRIGFGMAV